MNIENMARAAVDGLEELHQVHGYGVATYDPFKRASGPFADGWHGANAAGVFFGMFMPLFVAFLLFLGKEQRFWRFASIGGILVLAGGTLFTFSRQSYFIVLMSTAV